jgi:hypothetical protein
MAADIGKSQAVAIAGLIVADERRVSWWKEEKAGMIVADYRHEHVRIDVTGCPLCDPDIDRTEEEQVVKWQ